MDWIDPRYISKSKAGSKSKKNSGRGRSTRQGKKLENHLSAALAQPLDVWSVAFDYELAKLKWPTGCTIEGTFLWSAVIQEQAEVLVRAGMSAKRLSAILADEAAQSVKDRAEQLSEVVGLMDQSIEDLAFKWLDAADAQPHAALGVAGLAWHLPDHARRPASDWLAQWLQALTDRIPTYEPTAEESVLCSLVLQCEIPLLVGVATSASKSTIAIEASDAMDHLAEHLESAEDDPSLWLAYGATYLRSALASVLRSRVLANSLGLRGWYPPQQKALSNLLVHAARWSRHDGTQMLCAGNAAPRSSAIWNALVGQTRKPKSMISAMTLAGLAKGDRAAARKSSSAKLPPPTYYCENASSVSMIADWKQKSGRLAVDFSDSDICIEATGPKGHPVLAGEWLAKVELAGQAQLQLDEWGELCWFTDDEVDYLELEARFGQHAKVQRQAILFRNERLVFLADALLCDKDGDWQMESALPLGADIEYVPCKKTTEGFLQHPSGLNSLVLPIHLPEWKRALNDQHIEYSEEESCLKLTNKSTGARAIYSPMLISLHNRHAKQPFTWRNLTVGEDLRVVGPDEACAYRVQLGKDQLLFYRTLAPARRRTTLGMHTLCDFYAGRFDAEEGEADPLVEVELDE